MSNRRVFMMRAVATAVAGAAAGWRGLAWADGPSPLSEDDPQAKEFAYVADTSKVDDKKFPEHRPEHRCLKCQIYDDGPNQTGGCPIFPGKLVAANGWCSAFS